MVALQQDTSLIPVSAIVATANRNEVLARTFNSLQAQGILPAELIIVDASQDDHTQEVTTVFAQQLGSRPCRVVWERAKEWGAAPQRNQGMVRATQPIIWFFDDDIVFEANCLARLWAAIQSDMNLGGVNAMIINQRYQPPGRISRFMFRLMAGRSELSYAGRVLGPAVNVLPEDRDDLSEVVPVQWLNTTCTLYRRDALPDPPFSLKFTGYSMMEDLSLSLIVGRAWKLANARTARIYHDSQPGEHKTNPTVISHMEIVNRYYVMTEVLRKRRIQDYIKLALWQTFQMANCAIQTRFGLIFWRMLYGKWLGLCDIVHGRARSCSA
jgi:GT2 family glycosyltransferase